MVFDSVRLKMNQFRDYRGVACIAKLRIEDINIGLDFMRVALIPDGNKKSLAPVS